MDCVQRAFPTGIFIVVGAWLPLTHMSACHRFEALQPLLPVLLQDKTRTSLIGSA